MKHIAPGSGAASRAFPRTGKTFLLTALVSAAAIAARAFSRCRVPYVVSPNGTAKPIERRVLAKTVFAATLGRHLLRQKSAAWSRRRRGIRPR